MQQLFVMYKHLWKQSISQMTKQHFHHHHIVAVALSVQPLVDIFVIHHLHLYNLVSASVNVEEAVKSP